MRAEDLVELVERKGLVGLQDALGISRQRAESLDVEARRMIASGFGQSEVGRSLTASAIARQRQRPSATEVDPELTPETARVLAALDWLERQPTAEELANQQAQARLAEVARRNAEGADDCRAYAARMRAGGYAGWTGGQR